MNHGLPIGLGPRLRDKAGQRIFTYNGNFQEKAKPWVTTGSDGGCWKTPTIESDHIWINLNHIEWYTYMYIHYIYGIHIHITEYNIRYWPSMSFWQISSPLAHGPSRPSTWWAPLAAWSATRNAVWLRRLEIHLTFRRWVKNAWIFLGIFLW